jgi:lipase
VAGTRSRAGWDVPEWANDAAATYQELPGCGHMMMLEQPHRLATLLATLVHQGRVPPGKHDGCSRFHP